MKEKNNLVAIVEDIYRQLYREATPSADYDALAEGAAEEKFTNEQGQHDIRYCYYYLDPDRYQDIVEEHISKHEKLKKGEIDAIRFHAYLGCGPTSSKNTGTMTLNEEILLSCAFRYALGRKTYVTSVVCEELIKKEKDLPWEFKDRIRREIQEYQDGFGIAGDLMDDEGWNYVKWLFDHNRRVTLEANRHKTDVWEKCEAVEGEDGVYYSLEGKNKYFHTTRNIKKK